MNKIDTIQYIKTDVFNKIKNFNLIKFNSETKYLNETMQETKEDNKLNKTIISIDSETNQNFIIDIDKNNKSTIKLSN
jgi:hypothetical protein